jgi:membrane protein
MPEPKTSFLSRLNPIRDWAKNAKLPFVKMPAYYIFVFFYRNIIKESVSMKASSIAFNLFLSLFPSLIFMFTLIPFFPVHKIHEDILDYFRTLMPYNAFSAIDETLKDILEHPRGNLLSFSLVTALYFASNGLFSLLEIFNPKDSKHYLFRRVRAMVLTLILGAMLLLDLTILLMGETGIKFILGFIKSDKQFTDFTLTSIQWLMMSILIFCSNILLYYIGEPHEKRWRYVFPGALLSTIFVLITSVGYAFYVNKWGNYNKLYGSIGALIITMLWLYFNSIVLILGHEFNRSLHQTRKLIGQRAALKKS